MLEKRTEEEKENFYSKTLIENDTTCQLESQKVDDSIAFSVPTVIQLNADGSIHYSD